MLRFLALLSVLCMLVIFGPTLIIMCLALLLARFLFYAAFGR
jgi:hypothetical protein